MYGRSGQTRSLSPTNMAMKSPDVPEIQQRSNPCLLSSTEYVKWIIGGMYNNMWIAKKRKTHSLCCEAKRLTASILEVITKICEKKTIIFIPNVANGQLCTYNPAQAQATDNSAEVAEYIWRANLYVAPSHCELNTMYNWSNSWGADSTQTWSVSNVWILFSLCNCSFKNSLWQQDFLLILRHNWHFLTVKRTGESKNVPEKKQPMHNSADAVSSKSDNSIVIRHAHNNPGMAIKAVVSPAHTTSPCENSSTARETSDCTSTKNRTTPIMAKKILDRLFHFDTIGQLKEQCFGLPYCLPSHVWQ